MPIVRQLFEAGHTPVWAGSTQQITFIRKIFPHIEVAILSANSIRYGRTAWLTKLQLGVQAFSWLRRIKEEQNQTQKIVELLQIDGIISDNRYGCYASLLPSILLTHQLNVKTGFGQWADKMAAWHNKNWQKNFQEVWVVDVEEKENSLAGDLSHPAPENARYIGWLSALAEKQQANSGPAATAHVLIVLSGPEPQRSLLSKRLWTWAVQQNFPIAFVEGASVPTPFSVPAHITHYGQLGAEALRPLFQHAHYVICRSGYSTIMDLKAINRPAYFIPTPGQSEQQYLAKWLNDKHGFKWLEEIAALNTSFPTNTSTNNADHNFFLFEKALDNWLSTI